MRKKEILTVNSSRAVARESQLAHSLCLRAAAAHRGVGAPFAAPDYTEPLLWRAAALLGFTEV
jgi:hypothetical protein